MNLGKVFAAACALALTASPAVAQGTNWVVSWAAGQSCVSRPANQNIPAAGITYRNIVHMSLGGSQVRVRFSNQHGNAPLKIDDASIAVARAADAIDMTTLVPVRFAAAGGGSSTSVSVPAGGEVYSLPATIQVGPAADLSISFHMPAQTLTHYTSHEKAKQGSYFATGPSKVSDATLGAGAKSYVNWHFATAVDINGAPGASAIVAIGDSITDSGAINNGSNDRYPNLLFERLRGKNLAVVDTGIGSDRVLTSAVANCNGGYMAPPMKERWGYDALNLHGVSSVIVLAGINDIAHDPNKNTVVSRLQAEMRNLVNQAGNVQVVGGVLTPIGGSHYGENAQNIRVRQEYADWIKSAASPFDRRIDFETCVKVPGSNPPSWRPAWTEDFLHGNAQGTAAMATCAATIY